MRLARASPSTQHSPEQGPTSQVGCLASAGGGPVDPRGTVGYFASQVGSPVEVGCASALIELVSDERSALPELRGQNKGLEVTGPRRGHCYHGRSQEGEVCCSRGLAQGALIPGGTT